MTKPSFTIRPARTEADFRAAAGLFRAYAASLDVDLAYQDFEAELAALPGKYAAPKGALLLAWDGEGKAVGCAAMRPLGDADACEMKRLYVAPQGRGRGLGKALVEALVRAAANAGYREMRLDTLPSMRAAQALYQAMGFAAVPPYYETPIAGTLFMAKSLPVAPSMAAANAANSTEAPI